MVDRSLDLDTLLIRMPPREAGQERLRSSGLRLLTEIAPSF